MSIFPKDFNIATDWGEALGLLAFAGGVILSLSTGTPTVAYLGALLTGLLFGQRWFSVRKGPRLHWYVIILGFSAGYTLGAMFFASVKAIIVTFILGMIVGYFFKKHTAPAKKK